MHIHSLFCSASCSAIPILRVGGDDIPVSVRYVPHGLCGFFPQLIAHVASVTHYTKPRITGMLIYIT